METSTTTATKTDFLSFLAGFSQASPGVIRTDVGEYRSEDPESLKGTSENGERPTSAVAVSLTTNICSSDNEGTSTASDTDDSSKPTSATAVSPSRSLDSSDAEEEDNHTEIRPISLDELKSTENASDPRIDAELAKELSFYSDCDSKERDWTNKISVVNDSSGNLIEDLGCDDSSASSVTTIIDSEQSSSARDDDDLEDTFRSEDEGNDEDGVNQGSLDPLQSRYFVIFGDDEDERNINNKDNSVEATNGKETRAKTSNINPMSGKRSLTDDMQEWKDTVLSSWTLTPPKKRKKYTKRKKGIKNEHTYLLRRNMNQTEKVAAASANISKILESGAKKTRGKRSRLLQSIAPFNQPGVSEAHREFSPILESQSQEVAKTKLQTDSTFLKLEPNRNKRENTVPDQDLSQQCSKKRKKKRGRPPKKETHLPTMSKNTKTKTLRNSRPCAKEKQDNNSQSKNPLPKSSRKGREEPLNLERISNGSTRVAKRFIFNPTRKKGQEKTKIFYGTVAGKIIADDSVESSFPMWHIVYDDGDEAEFNAKELKGALNLYKYAKRWDKNYRD